jgi:glucoamylase
MPRDLPIGNGNILVSFDQEGILREFYFPYVGEENHTKGEPFRFGVWIDGSFSWVPQGWKCSKKYLENSLVTDLRFEKDGIQIQCNDCVDFGSNVYLRKITVENLLEKERDVRLFFAQDFHISGNDIGDTAAFRPENNSLIHYKGERYFLINIFANHKMGIDFFATGRKQTGTDIGTWKDAEDGVLSQNPIAQGSVDSVVEIPFIINSLGKEISYYWIGAGTNWEEVKELNEMVKKKGPEEILKRTFEYWKLWASKEEFNRGDLPEKLSDLYKKSLLICRTHINNNGSIIAANDSDAVYFNRDTYSYMWPRDGALVAYAFDLAGYNMEVFYRFCSQIVEKEGYFLHKYTPKGSFASSWHPWVREGKPKLPIQEDETALVIWALWNHYTIFKDLELIRSLYDPLIKKCADFMMNYRDLDTFLPLPSYDLWEEREGVLTFTVSAVYGGLMGAASFTDLFGESDLAAEYRLGALKMKEAMDRYLYLPDKKRFARMINFHKNGSIQVDDTIDASVYGTFGFGAYEATDEKVRNTMNQVIEHLSHGGGISRYENDSYYRQNGEKRGNPWFICTLWVAQYYIQIGDKEKALRLLEWVADHALLSGVLPEQINPKTEGVVSVSPLTWSHGALIATIHQFIH